MENKNADPEKMCVPCRVIGGLGLTGAGGYVAYYGSKSPNKAARVISLSFAGALLGFGIARACDIPLFHTDSSTEPNSSSS